MRAKKVKALRRLAGTLGYPEIEYRAVHHRMMSRGRDRKPYESIQVVLSYTCARNILKRLKK